MSFFKKDSLQIIVFQSYGTNSHFYTRGRALQDEKINLERENFFSLLINSWKRFESDEVKNTAVTEYIRHVRLESARDMLKNTDLNVSQIVYSVGFSSRSYFSKIFREKYDISPNEFKKKALVVL